MNQLIIFAK